nr:hypothetical protein [uncultured Hyphomonas sp.]
MKKILCFTLFICCAAMPVNGQTIEKVEIEGVSLGRDIRTIDQSTFKPGGHFAPNRLRRSPDRALRLAGYGLPPEIVIEQRDVVAEALTSQMRAAGITQNAEPKVENSEVSASIVERKRYPLHREGGSFLILADEDYEILGFLYERELITSREFLNGKRIDKSNIIAAASERLQMEPERQGVHPGGTAFAIYTDTPACAASLTAIPTPNGILGKYSFPTFTTLRFHYSDLLRYFTRLGIAYEAWPTETPSNVTPMTDQNCEKYVLVEVSHLKSVTQVVDVRKSAEMIQRIVKWENEGQTETIEMSPF